MSAPLTIRDFAELEPEEAAAIFAMMTPQERAAKLYDWGFWARPEQLLPPGDWIYWMPLAGRGWGKTRTGAEAVRQWIKEGFTEVNLIGATENDIEKIMIRGPSGILAVCPPDERPRYVSNKHELRWPNGAVSNLYSAEKSERLRGPNHQKLWCDEVAAWRYDDAWDQAMLGLRLPPKPQVVITTTPRPTPRIKALVADAATHLTRHSTYENAANLAESFLHQVEQKYGQTRLGRQELYAQILDDVQGALFMRDWIENNRAVWISKSNGIVGVGPDKAEVQLRRIVVAIDPAVSTGEKSDETGIIACGADDGTHWPDGIPHGYLLDDGSGKYPPNEWSRRARHLFHQYRADCIVAEVNNGGDLVEHTIQAFDGRKTVPVRTVHATRGKVMRAEPVSLHYEKGRIHHIGAFPTLEDQMCVFTNDFVRTAGNSPDRMDAMVWGFWELLVGPRTDGFLQFYGQEDRAEKEKRMAEQVAVAIRAAQTAAGRPAGALPWPTN